MRNRLIPKSAFVSCVCLLFSLCNVLANWPAAPTDWKGFERYDFEVDGRDCFVVAPKTIAEGKPWVWRARFPNYHPEVDLLLLERGFHIAFMNTNGMLGSPTAMKHWDTFYETMTDTYGLSTMPALEAVSRGGLFAYRWASRHPDRVSCIYADTPVCDFKSWPLGQGEGLGHSKTWENLLEQYGFTEEEALTYDKNPIDVLEPIAEWGIPLMTIVSLNATRGELIGQFFFVDMNTQVMVLVPLVASVTLIMMVFPIYLSRRTRSPAVVELAKAIFILDTANS